jgi:hypothetical protein
MAKKVRSYRRHPVGMKQKVIGRMEAGESVKAAELGVNRTLLYVRKRKAAGQPYGNDSGPQDLRDQRIRELEAKIGQLEAALGELSIAGMCQLAEVSRASFYRHWEQAAEMALRDAIQRTAVAHRYYGYRRIQVSSGRVFR